MGREAADLRINLSWLTILTVYAGVSAASHQLSEELARVKAQLAESQKEVEHVKKFTREAHGKAFYPLITI